MTVGRTTKGQRASFVIPVELRYFRAMIRWAVPVVVFALVSVRAAPVAAQDASAKATAEALFAEARRLMASGQFDAACRKFEASERQDPGVGTLLNLADCYEKSGRYASAWAQFREARTAAHAAGSKDREELARDRARALEGKLSYLTVTTSPAQRGTIQIRRDGIPIEAAVLDTPIPIDPGKHRIEATVPGKKSWAQEFDVSATSSKTSIAIPELTDDTPIVTETSVASRGGGTQRAIGIGAGVMGAIGIATGTVFGIRARSTWDDAKTHCNSYPYGCDADAISRGSDAKQAATISTISFLVGGAGLVGGALLYFTAAKGDERTALAVGLSPTSVTIAGSFP